MSFELRHPIYGAWQRRRKGQAAPDRRGAVRGLSGGDRGGAGPCEPGRVGAGLLHRAAAAGRAQEHRADGGPDRAGPGAGGAPVAAPRRGQGRMGRCGAAAGGARAGAAGDRAARPGAVLDRGRHRLPEAGQALGRRRPAVLRAARQAGQLSGGGQPVGGERPCQPADRLSALPARGLGRGSGAAGQGGGAGGDRLRDQDRHRARAAPAGAGRGRAARCGAGRCRLRRRERLPGRGGGARPALRAGHPPRDQRLAARARRRCRPSLGPAAAGRRPGCGAARSTSRCRSRTWPRACPGALGAP